MSEKQIYTALGKAIATRRKLLKRTQSYLAVHTGMSRASIANIERGHQKVALHHIYNIASVLEISKISDLLPPFMSTTSREEKTMDISDRTLSENQKTQISNLTRSALTQSGQKSVER